MKYYSCEFSADALLICWFSPRLWIAIKSTYLAIARVWQSKELWTRRFIYRRIWKTVSRFFSLFSPIFSAENSAAIIGFKCAINRHHTRDGNRWARRNKSNECKYLSPRIFCMRNHFASLLFFSSQFAVDKGIYWRDLQSLYCVFISFDLMLCMWNEFWNSFRGSQAAEIRNLSLPSPRSLLSNLCRMCLRFSFIPKIFSLRLRG